jgi:hypothetical protein
VGTYTFSERGEDILVHRLLLWKRAGVYLDGRCYDPLRMSMTARLKLYGWSGINLDLSDTSIREFKTYRPDDINLKCAIGLDDRSYLCNEYEDGVLNIISPGQQNHLKSLTDNNLLHTTLKSRHKILARSLRTIISEINPCPIDIDFLNLDIEGMELVALKGFHFELYGPSIIAVELHRLDLTKCLEDECVNYLYKLNYRLQSYVMHTAIFCKIDFDEEFCHRFPFPQY